MKREGLAKEVLDLLEEPATMAGLELVDVECAGGRSHPIVRVFIDTLDGGITLDEVAEATQWISDALDDADPVPCAYTLEVSSPGIDRPLRKLEDFDRFAGEDVSIKTRPIDGRSSWRGTLLGTDGGVVRIAIDEGDIRIAYEDIKKANILGRIDLSKERGARI